MFTISPQQLRAAVPRCGNADLWAQHLNDAMLLYGIAADVDYMVEFLAQCAHESSDFTRLIEGLWYTPDRLCAVWPKRFPNAAAAAPYAGAPHKLADFVYSNRMGNGPPESGDGWNYRGRGLIMVTGRENYARVAKLINDKYLMDCPERLAMPSVAALAAAAWWSSNPRLNQLADDMATDDDYADFVSITRLVNGGTVGLAHRAQLRDKFSHVLRGRNTM